MLGRLGQNIFDADRFAQQVIATSSQDVISSFIKSIRGQRADHGFGFGGFDLPRRFVSVHHRHPHVHPHEIRPPSFVQCNGLLAIGCYLYRKSHAFEQLAVVFYIESRRFLIRDSPRPATTYEQKTGGADGVKGA